MPWVRSTSSSETGSRTILEFSRLTEIRVPGSIRREARISAGMTNCPLLLTVVIRRDMAYMLAQSKPRKASSFPLDTFLYVTLWLRIMRNRSVTYSPEAAFHALADPTRRAVLDLLRQGVQPAGRIAQAFPVSRPAISKHLRLLRRAHLVQERREGRHRLYQLNPEPLKAVDSWLQQYRVFWQANLASLKAFVETEHARETAGSGLSRKDSKRSRPNE
jgi:DNA-binding transcriptional ArsR family regulator